MLLISTHHHGAQTFSFPVNGTIIYLVAQAKNKAIYSWFSPFSSFPLMEPLRDPAGSPAKIYLKAVNLWAFLSCTATSLVNPTIVFDLDYSSCLYFQSCSSVVILHRE